MGSTGADRSQGPVIARIPLHLSKPLMETEVQNQGMGFLLKLFLPTLEKQASNVDLN